MIALGGFKRTFIWPGDIFLYVCFLFGFMMIFDFLLLCCFGEYGGFRLGWVGGLVLLVFQT